MICKRCGRNISGYCCKFCGTVHTPDGNAVSGFDGMLCFIADKYGAKALLDKRKANALFADYFPKEDTYRKQLAVAECFGCVQKLYNVRNNASEIRRAEAEKQIRVLHNEIGVSADIAINIIGAVGKAVGCKFTLDRKTLSMFKETSSAGITDAGEQYALARHSDRLGEYEKALFRFEAAAFQGHAEAAYYAGIYRLEGRGGEPDAQKAREWFIKAAEKGIPQADYFIGYFYTEGIACEHDEHKAYEHFMKSAERGCKEAAELIAKCYEKGIYVDRDRSVAEKWRRHIAESGLYSETAGLEVPDMSINSGEILYQNARRCLANGDPVGAAGYYKRAADLGHVQAQCSYGKCLYTGNGTAKDPAEAFRYFKMAADGNSDIARYNLGVMYLKGVYVPKDIEKAREYFSLAAAAGHEEALKILEKLK